MPTPQDTGDARDLLVAAFESARATGKRDWNTMTAAVLKNRVLHLTSRSFDEAALGFKRSARSHWLPTAVPARRCLLRTSFHRDRLALTVRAMGQIPARPTHRRQPPRPALPPRPHHHHHRRQLPTHPPHHPKGGMNAKTFSWPPARTPVGHQRGQQLGH